ncbi:uncharacterized protein LOC119560681 [Drosophila subpulchrella]|uniref:uncharacterized protein LOC119560681 n=1 Tax=Drosophila subpulchrella TaxID=1486046 RepID=UPI0018A15BE3|nr:uncharacterized protein LOC119560681 [Drosophila subpulchrella]
MFTQYLLLVSAIIVLGSDVNRNSPGENLQDSFKPEHLVIRKREVEGESEHSTQPTTPQSICPSNPQPELNPKAKLHKWTWYDIIIVIFLLFVVLYVRMSLYKRDGDNCCFGCKWGRTTNERPETRVGILNQQETET